MREAAALSISFVLRLQTVYVEIRARFQSSALSRMLGYHQAAPLRHPGGLLVNWCAVAGAAVWGGAAWGHGGL